MHLIGELLDIIKRMDDPWAIVDLIYEDWMYHGDMIQDREKGILDLWTDGWPGNVSIILALRENPAIWGHLVEEKRGGYYRFTGLR
jgi:hypothetical protein